jgi:1-phosphatidylinositol phosphodiesterase
MACPLLTIRNLTLTTTELKLVERYQPPRSQSNDTFISNIIKTFTAFIIQIIPPSSQQLEINSATFRKQEVSIPIVPCEARKTDIQPNPNEVLRFTFETNGQRYRLDTPTSSHRSIVLTPLSLDPQHEYTAIYLPAFSYLALFSSVSLGSWMSKLKDEYPLSALSIPGTHNSPAHHIALPSVRCQVATIKEQLENGVRFLDIRLQPENPRDSSKDGLILVHSAFPISLTGHKYFRDLVNDVITFLDQNPSETVIMSLKREGVGRATDQQLSRILRDHYANDPNRWFTEPRIPTLGEARNKIVVIRRLRLDESLKSEWNGTGWGIDAESWPDNCPDGMCGSGDIRIQDFYEVEEAVNIEKKIEYSIAQLERAAQRVYTLISDEVKAVEAAMARQPLFINFLSASNFFRPGCWPDKVAARVNPSIIDFLCRRHNETESVGVLDGKGREMIGDGSTGIVVCDWVGYNGDWDLVRCIVGHNARLEARGKI